MGDDMGDWAWPERKNFEIGGVYRCTYKKGTVTPDRSVQETTTYCLIRVIALDNFEVDGMAYTMLGEDLAIPRFGQILKGDEYFPDEVDGCHIYCGRDFYELYINSWHVWKYELLFLFATKLIVLARRAKARVAHKNFAPGGPGFAEAAARFEAYTRMQ